jgi:hypothetical protein
MLFRICEHYDDNQLIYEEWLVDEKDCFICFEKINMNESKIHKLNNQLLFIKNCRCDVYVHKKCLKTWSDMYKSCPICRKNVTEINFVYIILYNYIPFGNYIYFKIIKFSYTMIRFMFILLVIYNILDFYLRIYKFNSKIYEDYTHNNNIDYSYWPDIFSNESINNYN